MEEYAKKIPKSIELFKRSQSVTPGGVGSGLRFWAPSPFFIDRGEGAYLWDIDGEEREGNAVPYIFEKIGNHKVGLTITENNGESRSIELQANVVNTKFYVQLATTLAAIFLALIIVFKYIHRAEKSETK